MNHIWQMHYFSTSKGPFHLLHPHLFLHCFIVVFLFCFILSYLREAMCGLSCLSEKDERK